MSDGRSGPAVSVSSFRLYIRLASHLSRATCGGTAAVAPTAAWKYVYVTSSLAPAGPVGIP